MIIDIFLGVYAQLSASSFSGANRLELASSVDECGFRKLTSGTVDVKLVVRGASICSPSGRLAS